MLLFHSKCNIDSASGVLQIEEINFTRKSLVVVRKLWEEVLRLHHEYSQIYTPGGQLDSFALS
jgi:hypothetical protein